MARKRHDAGVELVEIVTPRTNVATISAMIRVLDAATGKEPISLEIAATESGCAFYARAGAGHLSRLARHLGSAYPQAELRPLDTAGAPALDPAWADEAETIAVCTLAPHEAPYLPIRTLRDADVAADRASQADPILGILGAMRDLPDGWRMLNQLVLHPAPPTWSKGFERLALERPLDAVRRAETAGGPSLGAIALLGGVAALMGALPLVETWRATGAVLPLALTGSAAIVAPFVMVALRRLFRGQPPYDPLLVREKLSGRAALAQLRLAVFAPATASVEEVRARLDGLVAAYEQFTLPMGNHLAPCAVRLRGDDLAGLGLLRRRRAPFLRWLPSGRATALLTSQELAGLWHLPLAQDDVPFVERTASRRRFPLPTTVAMGCRIGASAHHGRSVPVALPADLLRRHLLLVAKTRRGKSSLMLRLAQHAMAATGPDRPALVLVDPHRDLARAALGLVPAARQGDVVYLDMADRARPIGLNLLDTGLFRDRDKAVANALAIFRREFDRFWGPRMEDAFRFALLTLYEANQAIRAADPDGGRRQHTVLEVPAVLVDTAFRRGVLLHVADPVIKAWWSGYFDVLDRRLQIEISNPVQTKVHRFAGNRAARAIVGSPQSTIDPSSWVRSGAIVLVDTAKGTVGEDTAALLGATVLNLVALCVGEQATLDPGARRPVTLVVDEFHNMPGADYEAILAELSKYGANLVLATQSLARLAALDREQHRALRSTVFANLDGLFAFHTSAEDAQYLVRELGDDVDEQDLVALGEHQCYARLSAGGERLPVFSVRLDPPPRSDPALADRLAAASAARYGRDAEAAERDLRSALARIELSHRAPPASGQSGQSGAGVARDAPAASASQPPKARNNNRTRRKVAPHQGTLIDSSTPTDTSPLSAPAGEAERDGPEAEEGSRP